jgi:MYXO-CTERM domain-containing protein
VQNCDSHDNFDAMSSTGPGTNADGFGCHSPDSPGNVFRGDRAWFNGDDGYDFLQATQPILIEDSWGWNNGYLSGTTTASGGDGNGFKGGGFGSATSGPTTGPQHTVRNCVSFLNRANGFYANHEPVGNFWYNNTAFNNRGANFNMLGLNGTTAVNVGVLRNNVAFTGTAISNGTGAMIDDASNSWTAGFGVTVSAADFLSTVTTGWDAPRGADGSLPVLPSLHLAAGSDLIDKGANVNLPFTGPAPDLGAFEVGIVFDAGSVGGTGAGGGGGTGGAGGAPGTGGRPNRDAGTAAPDASVGTGAGGAGGGASDGGGTNTGAGGASASGNGGSNGGAAGSGTAGSGAGQGGGPSGTGAGGSFGVGGATSGGTATGGGAGSGGPAGAEGGCSCRMTASGAGRPAFALTILVGLAAMRRRRRRA